MESQRTPRAKPSVKVFTTFLTRQAETTASYGTRAAAAVKLLEMASQ